MDKELNRDSCGNQTPSWSGKQIHSEIIQVMTEVGQKLAKLLCFPRGSQVLSGTPDTKPAVGVLKGFLTVFFIVPGRAKNPQGIYLMCSTGGRRLHHRGTTGTQRKPAPAVSQHLPMETRLERFLTNSLLFLQHKRGKKHH